MLQCDMAEKVHMVRVYDAGLFGRVRVRAAEEGRTVGALVENALRLYVAAALEHKPEPSEPLVVPALPKAEALRELVRSVPMSREDPSVVPGETRERVIQRLETAREKAMRIAERQAYLKDHPEEEGQ